jgi:hypothetical protein
MLNIYSLGLCPGDSAQNPGGAKCQTASFVGWV